MDQLSGWGHQHASQQQAQNIAERIVDQALGSVREPLVSLIVSFITTPISPSSFFAFETELLRIVREFGRLLI